MENEKVEIHFAFNVGDGEKLICDKCSYKISGEEAYVSGHLGIGEIVEVWCGDCYSKVRGWASNGEETGSDSDQVGKV